MTDNSETIRTNVGTIGHVDHGKTTLLVALSKVLSAKDLGKVVVVDGGSGASLTGLEHLADIEIAEPYSDRATARRKKKARKAKLAELQRKAFLKEQTP